MRLTKKIIQESKKYKTPFLLMDPDHARENYRKIKHSIDGVEVFYAMKANDHQKILEVLVKEESSFEISSLNELKSLLALNVSPEKIMSLNPIKSPEFLTEMEKVGVELMAYDSTDEIDKIVKYAPHAKLFIRLNVSNEGSDWPLTKKFGVDAPEILPLLRYAKKKGCHPIGITFHVGSQCLNKNNWVSALYICDDIWNQAKKEGINLYFLSLGGGIPIQHLKKIPTIAEIGEVINTTVKKNFKIAGDRLRISIEPGRGLIGDSGIMVTTVIGKAKRGTEEWIYIDAGVFNGFMETIENFAYEIKTEYKRKKRTVTIAGPSCDSVDVPFKNYPLSEVKVGERVYIINAGAYTTVYASNFNGFNSPKIYFIK